MKTKKVDTVKISNKIRKSQIVNRERLTVNCSRFTVNALLRFIACFMVLLILCSFPFPISHSRFPTLVSDAYAAVPARIKYQGRYRENGIPVDGTRHFQFKLIDSVWSSGNVRYDSGDQTVTVAKGLFCYVLEPTLNATTWDNQNLWIHVWVGASTPDTHLDAGGISNAGEQVSSLLYSYYSMSVYNATNATGTFTIDTSGGYFSAFTAGAQSGNVSYILPTALPASDKYLRSTGAGVLSWEYAIANNTGGEDGEVQYNNGGSFNGADALYYDDGNNRLGIGTTSPGNKLHVLNTGGAATNAAGYFELTNASNGSFTIYAMAPEKAIYASGNVHIKASGYINFGETSGDGGYGIKDNGGTIQYKNSSDEEWSTLSENTEYWQRNAGSGYIYNDPIEDTIGVGTNAPAEEMDIVGGLGFTKEVEYTQVGYLGMGRNNDLAVISRTDDGKLRIGLGSSGTARLCFFTDGNSQVNSAPHFHIYGDVTSSRLGLDRDTASWRYGLIACPSGADGSVYLLGNYYRTVGASWAKYLTTADGTIVNCGTDYGLRVRTRTAADGDGAPTDRFIIALDGNVGIGTTNPAGSILHSRNTGTSNSAGYFELTNASNSSYAVYAYAPTNAIYASGNIVVTGTIDGVDISAQEFKDNLGDAVADQNIVLGSNWLSGDGGNEGVYVDATGDVGIGTSSPDNKLHIQGGSNAIALLILNQVGTDQYAGYRIDRDGTETWLLAMSDADNSLRFRYNNSTDNFVMDTSGNTTIAGTLTVTGNDINSAANTKFGGGYGGTGATIESDGDLTIDGNAVIDGKIAIGTTVPNYNLSVVEDGNPTVEIANPNTGNPATAGTLVFRNGIGTVWGTDMYGMALLYDGSNNKMYVQGAAGGAASTLVTILRAGGVGIGTTDPAGSLHSYNTAANNSAGYFELTNASNASYAVYALAPTNAINSSGNIVSTSQGDSSILLEADTDNGASENDNPRIKFSQDGGAVTSILGEIGTIEYDSEYNSYTNTLANATLFGTIDDTTDGDLQLGTNGAVRVTILTDGKIGIGTNVPKNTLDIQGNVAVGADYAGVQTLAAANGMAIQGRLGIGTYIPDTYGALTVWQWAPDSESKGVYIMNTANTGDLRLWVDSSNQARIDSESGGAGTIILNSDGSGKIAIGTTTPGGSKFHGYNSDASNAAGYFQLTNASNSSYAMYAYAPTNAIYASGNIALTGTIDGVNISTVSFRDNLGDAIAAQNIVLGSNWLSGDGGNEGVYVGATGNVGIGTSSPASILHIQGISNAIALAILNQVGADAYGGYRIDRDGTETWLLGMSDADDSLRLRYNNSTDNLVINTSGNTTIAGDLTVSGSNGINASADTKFGGGYGGSGVTIESDGDITVDGNTIVDGNVGIVVTEPNEPLEVGGTGRVLLGDGGGASRKGILFDGVETYGGRIQPYDYGAVDELNLVLQDLGGNVGVGTTDPVNGRLEVYNNDTTNAAGYFKLANASNSSYAIYSLAPTDAIYASGEVSITGDLTVSGNDINSVADTKFGGGYGGTGVTIESDGDLSVDGNAIVIGNVGIGTTAANFSLSVVQDDGPALELGDPDGGDPANAGSIIFNEDTGAATGGYTWGTDVYGFRFTYDGSANNFIIQSAAHGASSDRLTIDRTSGNVGIGTSIPVNGRLESYSNETTNAAGYFKLANASNSSYAVYALASADAIYASGNVSLTGDLTVTGGDINSSADINFGGGYGSTGLTLDEAAGDLQMNGDLTVGGGNDIKDSGGNNQITFTAGSLAALAYNLKVTGNDIQDSGGAATLTFDGSGNTTAKGSLTVLDTDYNLFQVGGGTFTVKGGGVRLLPTDTVPSTEEGTVYSNDTANVIRYYNGSGWVDISAACYWAQSGTKLYYNTTGNVGIGTTDPAGSKLHSYNTGTSNAAGYFQLTNASNSSFSMYAYAPANAIYASGNISIGDSSPSVPLTVTGGTGVAYNSASGYLIIGNDAGAHIAIDDNEIMAKSDATHDTILYVPTYDVRIGNTSHNYSQLILTNSAHTSYIVDSGDAPEGLRFYSNNATEPSIIIEKGAPGAASGFVGVGDAHTNTTIDTMFDVRASGDECADFDRATNDGIIVYFSRDNVPQGNITVSGGSVTLTPFTGSHYAWTNEKIERGMLVSLTGQNKYLNDNPEHEIMYGVTTTSRANDPSVLGSYLCHQEPNEKMKDDLDIIMAVGNGDMWVADKGDDINTGDYLISSDIPGHAMKDPDNKYMISYVFARAVEPVKWSEVKDTINGVKHKKISVTFKSFVRNKISQLYTESTSQYTEISELKKKDEDQTADIKGLQEEIIALKKQIMEFKKQ